MCVTRFILLFLLNIVHLEANQEIVHINDEEELKCPPASRSTVTSKLRSDVFDGYDRSVTPISGRTNKTKVSFTFLLNHFTYDDETGIVGVHAWLSMYWMDTAIKWSPKDYDNIRKIQVYSYEVWSPALSAHKGNEKPEYANINIYSIKCAVYYNGLVSCVPPVYFEGLCSPDLSRYPFDTHNCSFMIGSWREEDVVDLQMNRIIDVDASASNQQWKLINISSRKNSSYPQIQMNLKIKRMSGSHAASIIILSLVAAILTFTSLTVSPVKRERLILCYINIIAQFLNIQNLSWIVPIRGDQVPLLLVFERDCLLMTTFLICFTVLFKNLMQKKSVPPMWISRVVSFIMGSVLGQYICLGDYSIRGAASFKNDDDTEVIVNSETNTNSQNWELLARSLDKLLLISYVIAYIVLSVKLLP